MFWESQLFAAHCKNVIWLLGSNGSIKTLLCERAVWSPENVFLDHSHGFLRNPRIIWTNKHLNTVGALRPTRSIMFQIPVSRFKSDRDCSQSKEMRGFEKSSVFFGCLEELLPLKVRNARDVVLNKEPLSRIWATVRAVGGNEKNAFAICPIIQSRLFPLVWQ